MKKKIASVILAVAMMTSLLTACGGSKEASAPTPAPAAETPAPAATPAPAGNDDTKADTADGEMVSDEIFSMLQENYALLTQLYDAVAELYNSDEVAANPEIEEAMAEAYDILEQMGEITQDTITEEDAITLNDAMGELINAFDLIVDGMEPAEAADGEMVSDETFAVLQENYALLTQLYDAVAEAYNSDEVEANPEIEEAMNQAYDIIEQMGEITQDTLTQEDAVELSELMVDLVDLFQAVVDEM